MENIDSFFEYMCLIAEQHEAETLKPTTELYAPPAEKCLPFSEYLEAQERDILFYGV